MWFSKIDEFACWRSKVTPDNMKSLIAEKRMIEFLFIFSQKFSCLTFSTLKKFGSETAMGLRVMYNFHPLWVILALLVLLKSTISSFVKHIRGHPLYCSKPWKILFNMTSHN